MRETLGDILFVVAAILAIFLAIGGPVAAIGACWEHNVCEELAARDESHRYEWTFWTGCRVHTPAGYWVHYKDAGIIHLAGEE